MAFPIITAEQFKERLIQQPASQVIDVRTPVEYREIHVKQAQNISMEHCRPERWQGKQLRNDPLYVLCQSGKRAQQVCQRLSAAGIEVVLVDGGTKACVDAGLDVVRGRKAVSLERQVRMTAGVLIVAGCALTWWVHPYFLGLPAFIGAGLLFAGITDTCGMGMLLARMPWNHVNVETPCEIKSVSVERNFA